MNNKVKRIVGIILFTILIVNVGNINTLAINNTENRNFKRLTIDDGLSQMTTECLFQDSYGYMWIGTRDGLNKYNGHDFEIYKYKEGKKNSISGNSITDIKEDKNGDMWIGTTTGLNKIDRKTNEITQYLPNKNGCNISNYRIREILIGEDGNVLVATDDGLNKYDKDNDNFIRIYNSNNEEKSLTNQMVNTIVEDENGYYWVGTKEGLNQINKNTNEIIKHYSNKDDKNSITSNHVYKLYVDNLGFLWVGTYYGYLSKIDLNNGEVTRYTNENTNIKGGWIKDILRDSRGTVWIGTEMGFSRLDEENNSLSTYKSKSYDQSSIISNDILGICEDKSGTIWIATLEGISLFNPDNEFNNYKNDPVNSNSFSENKISGIYEDNDGILWVGTIYNGLNIFDRKNNKVTRIDHNKKDEGVNISNNLIRKITGIDNEIWIATEDGLDKYDKTTNITTKYKKKDGLICNDVRTLFIDSEGLLWIGTREGLNVSDRKGNFINYTEILKESGIVENKFSDIHEDKDGTIWLAGGADNGLIKYDKTTNRAKKYNSMSSDKGKSYDVIMSINSDDKGDIWIGTDKGLIKFNKESEKFVRYTESDGLANNFIYGVLLDENEDVWVSTNYGISKFDTSNNRFINFDSNDGIQGNEFNEYSYFKSKSGEMFFGGVNGLTSFKPENVTEKEYVPTVTIESITSNCGNLEIKDNIDLKYKNNQINFRFFITQYVNPHKTEYAYKLQGLDEDWVFAGNRNYANYTNLKPGNYIFEVVAKSFGGEWSVPKAIKITIDRQPWNTPTAYILYALIFLLTIFIVWNRVKILNSLVKQRTIELNKKLAENEELYSKLLENEKYKNNYFVNLSHELRTPLNIIVSTEKLIENLNEREEHIPKEKLKHYIGTMKRNSSRLTNLIDNIIYTSRIEAGNYNLDIEKHDIIYIVEESILSMKKIVEKKGIELIIEPDIEEKIIECDRLKIEKSIKNIMSNAVKYTDKGGKINVSIWDLQNYVEISIRDTGIGIEPKNHKAIFDRLGQTYTNTSEEYGGNGLGLTLTRQLIELHGGSIRVESKLGEGSDFIIILPVKVCK